MITIGRFEFSTPLGGTSYVYYRHRGRAALARYRVGFIRNRQFRRVTPEGWGALKQRPFVLSVTQGNAAIAALRGGLIGPR